MSLRIRRGGTEPAPPPPYGPTLGDVYVRTHAGTVANPATPPAGAINIGPGGLTQAAINAAGAGATLYMTGTTRVATGGLTLLTGQTLMGPADHTAILSGAISVNAVSEGTGHWSVTGQGITPLGADPWTNGSREIDGIDAGSLLSRNGVFLDDFPMWEVPNIAALDQPVPYGWPAFYWDTAANKIWMRTNPSGHRLEVCRNSSGAITANNAVLQNIVVEKYGNPASQGMVSIGTHGYAENCWFRASHGAGVAQVGGLVTDDSTLLGCVISYNGQAGIAGGHSPACGVTDILLDGCEISHNNIGGFNWTFEGGATKWGRTLGLTMRNNWVHDNYGMGLWTDAFNHDVLIEDNVCEDNYGSGVEMELGYGHICRRNSFYRNGYHHPFPDGFSSAGAHPADCMGVQIYQNNCVDNAAGIQAGETNRDNTACAPSGYITQMKNLDVHDNFIRHPNSHPSDTQGYGMGIAAGIRVASSIIAASEYYTPAFNNRWYNNTYQLGDLNAGQHFRWATGRITWAQWRAAGQDGGSTATQI